MRRIQRISEGRGNRLRIPPGETHHHLHMVLGPAKGGMPVRFRVRLNGASSGDDHGSDSSADGTRRSSTAANVQLVLQKGHIKDVTFEIEFLLDPGVEAFSFTFA